MELERFQRHSLIDWFSQEQVSATKVVVVGAGAIGNEVIKNLVLLGVRNISIYDIDTIEAHNLTRSVLFREEDVGKEKARVAAERALDLDSAIKVTSHCGDVWEMLSIKELRHHDVLICCVDNFETRIKLNQLCLLAGVNMVNAGIDSRYAVVESFDFESGVEGPCYECNLPYSAYKRIGERYSCGWLKKVSFAEKKIPTTIITSAMAGALAASVALRLGKAGGEQAHQRMWVDTINGTSTVTALSKNPECPGCGRYELRPAYFSAKAEIKSLFSHLQDSQGFGDGQIIELSDMVIEKYECQSCGTLPESKRMVMKKASDFDESIITCSCCGKQSARVILKDQFSLGELIRDYKGYALPCKYITTTVGEVQICLELEGDGNG
jgi:molybdopterin/thiamine biosynthesis adenylyltransferase